jgi:hypothetical protein
MTKFTLRQDAQFACCVQIFALGQTPCFAQSDGDAPGKQAADADQQILSSGQELLGPAMTSCTSAPQNSSVWGSRIFAGMNRSLTFPSWSSSEHSGGRL